MLLQFLGIAVGVLIGAAQQDAKVAIITGPLSIPVGDGKALLHHLPNALGQPSSLRLFRCGAPVPGNELQLCLTALLGRVVRSADKALIPSVIHVTGLLGHQQGEDEVHRIRHLPAGAEVPVQGDGGGVSVLLPIIGLIALPAAEEDLRHGLTKAVDVLLDVSHHEQVQPVPGDGPEQGVLHLVDVLVLIDHNFIKALGNLPGGRSGTAIRL